MKKFVLIVITCVFFLTGCSSKFAYNNIDWLVYWYTDDYVDLSRSQKKLLDPKLSDWLIWHRQTELAQYKTQLSQLKQQLNQGVISPAQWLAHFEQGRTHWLRARERIAPELIAMAPLLSDEQLESLFAKLQSDQEKRQKERDETSPQERLEENQKDMRRWIGKLSQEQKQIMAEHALMFVSNFDEWMQYRRNIQQASKALLVQRNTSDTFVPDMLSLIRHPERYQSPAYIAQGDNNRQVYAQQLARLSSSLTDKQKQHLVDELQDLIDTLDELIND